MVFLFSTVISEPSANIIELGFKLFEKDKRTAFPFHGGESEGLKRLHNYFFETKKFEIFEQKIV